MRSLITTLAVISLLSIRPASSIAADEVRNGMCDSEDAKFYDGAAGHGYVKDISTDRIVTVDLVYLSLDSEGFILKSIKSEKRTAQVILPSLYELGVDIKNGDVMAGFSYDHGKQQTIIGKGSYVSFDMRINCDETSLIDIVLAKPRKSFDLSPQSPDEAE
jgi:hypothetical protein